METPTLNAYILPYSVFSEEAIATANTSDIDDLTDSLLILRFWLALCDHKDEDATRALARLSLETHGGWPLYQITTGAVFLAIRKGVASDIIAALEAWLTGMANYPGNWQVGVLQAPEIVPWLSHFASDRLTLPSPKNRPRMTAQEKAFLQDHDQAINHAIAENLGWLRELGFNQPCEAIAKRYRLVAVNFALKEATIRANGDWPDIIIALNDAGHFQGSFLSH